MKVLLVHNFYGSEAPSGENQVVMDEVDQLRRRGDEVVLMRSDSDGVRRLGFVGQMIAGFAYLLNFFSAIRLSWLIRVEKPDVIHIHNTFPLISLWCLYPGTSAIPVVMTLHNYRLFCPAGIPMRDGKICTKCIDSKNTWWSILYRCYKGSRVATAPLAGAVAMHRRLGTLSRLVDKFIVLTPYAAAKFIAAGLPEDKVEVRPNGYALPYPRYSLNQEEQLEVLYVGRLGVEKGLRQVIQVWRCLGRDAPKLTLVGDGDLRSEIEFAIHKYNLNIDLAGVVPRNTVASYVARAQIVIIPSICIEGLPTVLLEALALGVPVLVSDVGPLPSLVSDEIGYVVNPYDTEFFAAKVMSALRDPTLQSKGRAARQKYLDTYTYEASLSQLDMIYSEAIQSQMSCQNNSRE